MVARLAIVVAIATTAGCYAPSFTDCELACSASGACPDGFECQSQVCRSIGATAACPATMPDAPDGDAMIDSPMVSPGHPRTPWGIPKQVLSVGSGVDDPSLTDDRLVIFVGVGIQIHMAARATATAPWGALSPALGLNSTDAGVTDDAPYISADGLTMHWLSNRSGGVGGDDIWRATRIDRTRPFTGSSNQTALNSAQQDIGGSISDDGLMMVLSSNRGDPVALTGDLYYATRAAASPVWEQVNRLTELNTTQDEGHPVLSPDKLTIYFHRFIDQTMQHELFEAHRASVTAPFTDIRRLTELSSSGFDGEPWVSQDGLHMFFSRTAGGTTAIYETSR